MKPEELYEKAKKALGNDGFNEKDTEFRNDAKMLGIKTDDVNVFLYKRWRAYMSKQTSFQSTLPQIEIEQAAFVSISPTDFGVARVYQEALTQYQKDPQLAISQNYVDQEGNPLGQKGITKGKVLKLPLSQYITWQGKGCFKLKGRDYYSMGTIMFDKEKPNMHTRKLYKFTAGLSAEDGEKKTVKLKLNDSSTVEELQELSIADYQVLMKEHFPAYYFTSLKKAAELAAQIGGDSKKNYETFYAFYADLSSDGVRVNTGDDANSDVMNVCDAEINESESDDTFNIPNATVWINKTNTSFPRNIKQYAQNFLVIGYPKWKPGQDGQRGQLSITAEGIIIDNQWLGVQDAEPVTPDAKTETAPVPQKPATNENEFS